MVLRLKDRRGFLTNVETHSLSPNLMRRKDKANMPDTLPFIGSAERLPSHHNTLKSPKSSGDRSLNKTNIIIVQCHQHPAEIVKFIDVSTSVFGPHCEVCIVNAEGLKQMKLERVGDLQNRLKKILKNQTDQLKTLENKIDSLTKDIKIANAMMTPIISKLDYMEKQAFAQLDGLFKKLRQHFTKFNPFRNTKDEIRNRIEEINNKHQELSYNDEGSLNFLREMLKTEIKMKEDAKNFILHTNTKLDNTKNFDLPTEKEIGLMQNAFDDFIGSLGTACQRFIRAVEK